MCLEYTQPSGSDHLSSDCESYEYKDTYGYKYAILGKLTYWNQMRVIVQVVKVPKMTTLHYHIHQNNSKKIIPQTASDCASSEST